jgi:hypothetical protein
MIKKASNLMFLFRLKLKIEHELQKVSILEKNHVENFHKRQTLGKKF